MHGVTTFMYNGGLEPRKQLELLKRYPIATLCAPPTEYRMLVKEDLERHQLPALRHCTATGEALSCEIVGAWRDRLGLTIHDGYGQAETTIIAANMPGMEVRAGSMGRPFLGYQVRVVGPADREVGDGEAGEIAIRINPERPPSLLLEYWKSPEENAAAFRGDYYFTGDLASRDSDGYLWFAGRADDLIISAGHRIGPIEVESVLLEHPAVMESAAVASPGPEGGTIVKAFVKLKPGVERNSALARELQEHVKRTAAPYKFPREIEFIDELPKTASGKVRRSELREAEKARAQRMKRRRGRFRWPSRLANRESARAASAPSTLGFPGSNWPRHLQDETLRAAGSPVAPRSGFASAALQHVELAGKILEVDFSGLE
jgi:acyl-coenzyme A synthetase/AMP-(fatty) acid ligase